MKLPPVIINDTLVHKQEAGTELEPMADLNTESEKKLGKLVSEKLVLFFSST